VGRLKKIKRSIVTLPIAVMLHKCNKFKMKTGFGHVFAAKPQRTTTGAL